MTKRNERNACEQCVTCSGPSKRNERNTPLGGVTVVRWAGHQNQTTMEESMINLNTNAICWLCHLQSDRYDCFNGTAV